MAVPFVADLLGYSNTKPNTADGDSSQSVAIADAVNQLVGASLQKPGGQIAGSQLESGVRELLAGALPALQPSREWVVGKGGRISDFWQYAHLARMDALVSNEPLLKAEIGGDYLVSPDVTVAVPGGSRGALPTLHAVVSCKFTLRSDRAQNIRHEAITMVRHRRGRQPHIVAVTAEPLPSRLAALCRGTGEVDAVYHTSLHELIEALAQVGNPRQQADLDEFVGQGRLFDLSDLPEHLSV